MWIVMLFVLPLIATAYPKFPTLLNWGILFPFASVTVGAISWFFLNVFTMFKFANLTFLLLCFLFIGIPGGAWFAKKANE